MATTIRLTRAGRAKRPFYRLVVMDSRNRRDGAYIEKLGIYNPIPEFYECDVDLDRAVDWLDKGATMSTTARSLLRQQGILYHWHLKRQGVDDAEIATKVEEFRTRRAGKLDADKQKRAQAEVTARADYEAGLKKKAEDAAKAEAAAKEAELAAAAAAAAEEAKADEPAEETTPAEAAPADGAEETSDAPAEEAASTDEPEEDKS